MLDTASRKPATEPPGKRPGHHALALILVLVLVTLAALGVGGVIRYVRSCEVASGPQRPVTFTVPQGASGNEVVDALHERGVLRCGLVSRYLLHSHGFADSIRAGTYDLTTNMAPDTVFTILAKPPSPAPTVRFTIPEGWRLTQIAARAKEELGIPAAQFLGLAQRDAYSLPPYLPEGKKTTEGFLFPNTYQFVKGETTAADVIERMLDDFRAEVAPLRWANAQALHVTPYQVIVVASMIEREARVPADRPKIAAVIYNRLKRGMPLAIDATLVYVDPTPNDGLSEPELHMHSPYNTRLHTGLPPTPISSPGLASIEAALSPAQVDYLYYVLCGPDGHHAFSASFAQFERDRARCGE